MADNYIFFLRKIVVNLKRIPGFKFALDPLRKYFAGRSRVVEISDFDGSLNIKLRLDEHMQSQIFWYGYYCRDIILLMDRFVKPGMVVIDVGANLGEVSLAAARRVGISGHVYAFEPMDSQFACLIDNININEIKQITPEKKGLSDQGGVASIYSVSGVFKDGTKHVGLGTLYPSSERSIPSGEIELTTLDEYCSVKGVERIDLVKIDVEGAELAVLQGGVGALQRFKPYLIVEIQPGTTHSAGYRPEDIVNLLKTLGYSFYIIGRKAKLREMKDGDLNSFHNVLCVPLGKILP